MINFVRNVLNGCVLGLLCALFVETAKGQNISQLLENKSFSFHSVNGVITRPWDLSSNIFYPYFYTKLAFDDAISIVFTENSTCLDLYITENGG